MKKLVLNAVVGLGAVLVLPIEAHAKFLSPDPVGFKEGGVGHFNRYVYSSNDPVNRKDPNGRDDFFVGGQGDGTFFNNVNNFTKRFAQGRVSQNRDVQFVQRGQVNKLVSGIQNSAARGSPVNIACHSRGCVTAMAAISEAGEDVANLVTVDPVNDGPGFAMSDFNGHRPDEVMNFVNVEGVPAPGNHDMSDLIEGIGEAESGPFNTSSADTQVQTMDNHRNFQSMFQAANGTQLFDDEYN